MVEGIDLLESILGEDLFKKEVGGVIKTDRGTEFSDVEGLEKDNDGINSCLLLRCYAIMSERKS